MLGLTRWLGQPSATRRTPSRLRLEHLEARDVPALFTVTSLLDSGSGSLRDAIAQANNEGVNAGADTIRFDSAIFGNTIGLSTAGDTTFGPSALGITSDITIDGLTGYTSGSGVTIARDAAVSNLRLFAVSSTGTLTLQGLTLSGGIAQGGDGGSGNAAGGGGAGMGGAVFNQGTLSIIQSLLTNNTATGGNGGNGTGSGISTGGSGGGTNGGAAGTPNAANGGFGGGGGGGGSFGGTGGNGGFGGGGGGRADQQGGNGGVGSGGFGGGNAGSDWGMSGGGGAGFGGAVFNHGGTVTVTNSTLAGNTAAGGVGGSANGQPAAPSGNGSGGGIFNLNGTLTVTSSTIAANTGDGVFVLAQDSSGGVGNANPATATFVNSILFGTTTGYDLDVETNPSSGGATATASRPNVIGTTYFYNSSTDTSGVVATDPVLGALASNGGPTQSMAISTGSSALDTGSNAGATGLTADQRGRGRIDGGTADIGAFEVNVAPTVASISRASGNPTNAASVNFIVAFDEAVTGVDAGDFGLTTTGSFSGASVTGVSGSGTTWTVTVATGTGTGTLRLDLNPTGTGIQDTAGNGVAGGFTGGQHYSVDTVPPTILGVTGPANGSYTTGQTLDFTVSFSEGLTRTGTPRLALTVGGQTVYADYQSAVGQSALVFRYTVQPGDLDTDGVVAASPVDLNGGTLRDILGNDAVLTFTPPTTTGVLVDAVAPAVTAVVRGDANPTAAGSATFTVTFGEAVTGVDASDFALTTAGDLNGASVTGVTGSGTTYTVTVNTGTGSGTLRLDVNPTGTGIVDAAGNAIAAGFAAGETYTLDRTPLVAVSPTPVTSPVASVPTTFAVSAPAATAGGTQIKVFDPATGQNTRALVPFAGFNGAVDVTLADVTGDGVADIIVGAGAGGGPRVAVFDGATGKMIASFFAFGNGFAGGVSVAVGDVTGDGVADIIVGAGAGGGPHVKVFDGRTFAEVRSFFAFDRNFTGGVRVAAGDVDGDGKADIVTAAGPGGGPQVKVFRGTDLSVAFDFFAYSPTFAGGVTVAVGDVNGDGFADIITGAGPGGGSHVKVFDGKTGSLRGSLMAFRQDFAGGVSVAATDADGDGKADIAVGAGRRPARRHFRRRDVRPAVQHLRLRPGSRRRRVRRVISRRTSSARLKIFRGTGSEAGATCHSPPPADRPAPAVRMAYPLSPDCADLPIRKIPSRA